MIFQRFFARVNHPELAQAIQHLLAALGLQEQAWRVVKDQAATYRQPYYYTVQGKWEGHAFTLSLQHSALGAEAVEEQLELILHCGNPQWQRWVIASPEAYEVVAQRRLDVSKITDALPFVIGSNMAATEGELLALAQRYRALWQLLGQGSLVLERERLTACLPWLPHSHAQQTALLRLFELMGQLGALANEPELSAKEQV